MESNLSEPTAQLLELEQLTNCKLRRRRRFHPQDIEDDDEFIPLLCTVPKEQAAPEDPDVVNDRSKNEISSLTEGYEMISDNNYATGSSSVLQNEIKRESSTAQAEINANNEHGITINLPTIESSKDLTQNTTSQTDHTHTTTQIPSQEITNPRTDQSSTSEPILSTHAYRSRAYSLSNAVADLRELPWHIDYSQNRRAISLHSSIGKSPSNKVFARVQTYYRNSQRLFQRVKQRLAISGIGKDKRVVESEGGVPRYDGQAQEESYRGYSDWCVTDDVSVEDRVEMASLDGSWMQVNRTADDGV